MYCDMYTGAPTLKMQDPHPPGPDLTCPRERGRAIEIMANIPVISLALAKRLGNGLEMAWQFWVEKISNVTNSPLGGVRRRRGYVILARKEKKNTDKTCFFT